MGNTEDSPTGTGFERGLRRKLGSLGTRHSQLKTDNIQSINQSLYGNHRHYVCKGKPEPPPPHPGESLECQVEFEIYPINNKEPPKIIKQGLEMLTSLLRKDFLSKQKDFCFSRKNGLWSRKAREGWGRELDECERQRRWRIKGGQLRQEAFLTGKTTEHIVYELV